jgi:LysR family nitrogen assimilation transcriptional regulator
MLERQRNPRGRLTIGLPPRVAHLIAADLVDGFRQEFPGATITVSEGLSIRLREWLLAGRVDLALLFDPVPSAQMHEETVLREPLVLASTRKLPPRVRLADLASRELVMPSTPHALRRLLEDHTRPRGHTLRIAAEVDSVQTVLSLVARGVGEAVVPASAPRYWTYAKPLHIAVIQAPAIRNRLVLAVPAARPATRLSRFGGALLKDLVGRHFTAG